MAEARIYSSLAGWTWTPFGGTLVPTVICPIIGEAVLDFFPANWLLTGVDLLAEAKGFGLLVPVRALHLTGGIVGYEERFKFKSDKSQEFKTLKKNLNL